jgi:hypothetical protein
MYLVFKFENNEPEFNTFYSDALNRYLSEGVDWSAAPFRGANIDDMQQFGGDSFAAGWLAYRSQAIQLLKSAVPYLQMFANEAKNEHGKNQLLQQVKNIQDFLNVNEVNPWKTPYGCPGLGAKVTLEERKVEALREIHKTPYGANLGKNGPEIVQGLKFANTHMPGFMFYVLRVDKENNKLFVQLNPPASHGVHPWTEDWNLEHTRWGFERGEYWQINEEEKAGIDVEIARKVANEADALKKRQFQAGGVFEGAADYEARIENGKAVFDKIKNLRKDAAREIMSDIENKTAETLNAFPKEWEYVPADLWHEYQANNRALQRLWDNHQHKSQEYKDLIQKSKDLQARINDVKQETIKKRAAENISQMVADAMRVTDVFVQAAKAAAQYCVASKAARAEMDQVKTALPITDKNGFLFLSGNEVFWLFHDGRRYLTCRWEDNEWVGWQTSEKLALEAAKTQLPDYLDRFIRELMPTK